MPRLACRAYTPTKQAAIIAQLAEERAAAARQQASAERAVDAASGAELAAAKLLADLQARVRSDIRNILRRFSSDCSL